MNNRVEDVKKLIDQIFGDAPDVEEVCEIYAELYHCIKDQMRVAIIEITSDE